MARFAIIISAIVLALGAPPLQAEPAGRLELTLDTCHRLMTRHIPAPDVAYRAGADVHGRPVVPADLGDTDAPLLSETVVIDLMIPLRRFLGPDAPPFTGDAEIDLGVIVHDGTDVWLNGERIGNGQAAAVAEACAERMAR